MSTKTSRYFQPSRSFKKSAMSESDDGQTLKIIGGVVVGAAVLALMGRLYMDHGKGKRKCRDVMQEETPPPCLHISPGKRRYAEEAETFQQVSNAISPSACVAPAVEQVCVAPVREQTGPARCEPVPEPGGEPEAKPCPKVEKTCAKQKPAPTSDELRIPYGCGDLVPQVVPIPKPCKELEEPVVQTEQPKRHCDRRKCVSIDPSKRRWPLLFGAPPPAERTAALDPKYASTCKCEPIDPRKRRF